MAAQVPKSAASSAAAADSKLVVDESKDDIKEDITPEELYDNYAKIPDAVKPQFYNDVLTDAINMLIAIRKKLPRQIPTEQEMDDISHIMIMLDIIFRMMNK